MSIVHCQPFKTQRNACNTCLFVWQTNLYSFGAIKRASMILFLFFVEILYLDGIACDSSKLSRYSPTRKYFMGWMQQMRSVFPQVRFDSEQFTEYNGCFDGRFISIDCVDRFQNESQIRSTFYKVIP